MKDPCVEACKVIVEIMKVGSSKDGRDDSWRRKPKSYHLQKAQNHARTAHLMETGLIPQDGEDHAHLALTRLAMAICIE